VPTRGKGGWGCGKPVEKTMAKVKAWNDPDRRRRVR
jgi:hypothetical protein